MSSYAGLDAKEANQQQYTTSTAATDKQASQCGEALANLLMADIERQDSSSSDDGDETTTAKGGVTTVTSPRRLPNINRSPLRISPRRTQQPKRTKGGDCAGLSLGNSVEDNVKIGDPDTIEHNYSMRECQEAVGFNVKFKKEDGTIDYELLELEDIRIPDGENRTPRRQRTIQGTTTMPSNQHRTTSAAAAQRTTTPRAVAVQQTTTPMANQHMTPPSAAVPPTASSTERESAAHTPVTDEVDATMAARIRVQQTSPRITPVADSLTDAQLKVTRKNYVLARHLCRWVSDSPPLGQCAPYSADEKRQVFGINGILFDYFPFWGIDKTETKSDRRNPRKKEVEFLVRYYCKARQKQANAGCRCMLYIARIDGAILAYVKVDKNGIPFNHSDHDIFPVESTIRQQSHIEAGKRAIYDEFSLSVQQKEFILKHIIRKNYTGNCQLIAENMMAATASGNLRVTRAQEDDPSKLADRIRKFCCTEMDECGSYLNDLLGGDMTAEDMKKAIQLLAMDDTSGVMYDGSNEFLKSNKFQTILREIKVVGTDYGIKDNGYGDFTYLHFEYRDAPQRALSAVQMYDDMLAQLETDFFKGVAVSDTHQCGHIGFSDLNHRYWLLGMGIFKSESGDAATHLLSRAVSLLKQAGGGSKVVLQDGSHALNAGIDNVNDELESEMQANHLNITDLGVNTNILGDEDDEVAAELGNFLNEGDLLNDGEDWDIEIAKLINILKRRRCFIHCMRTPYSRGGGYRGGRGSIPRSCLNDGMSYKELAIVTHKLMCVNYAPCPNVATQAIKLISGEHKFSKRVQEEYLNGNPLDLGGRGAGRPGECGSSQGVEKKGGNIKSRYRAIVNTPGTKDRKGIRNNFLNLMFAFAQDKEFDKVKTIAVEPDRAKLRPAYETLITFSGSTKMPADWLLSFCKTTGDSTDAWSFVDLKDVLGKKDESLQISWPSASRTCTSTRLLLEHRRTGQLTAGLMCLQLNTVSDISDHGDLTDFKVCNSKLEHFGKDDWKELKETMKETFVDNTIEAHPNERSLDYLRRMCQRYSQFDAEDDMLMKNSINKNPVKPRKKKKKKGNDKQTKSCNEARLEADKWGKETEEVLEKDNSSKEETSNDDIHLCFEIGADSDGVEDILNWYMREGVEDDGEIILDEESRKELQHMEDRNKRVKVQRELGDWITCTVKDGKITCNCERYVYWRLCKHVVWMEVLHLNKLPPEYMQGASHDWVSIRDKALHVVKETWVRI